MKRRTDLEMEEASLAKATRTLIRLKHSLRADYEINQAVNDRLDAFNDAIVAGEEYEVDLAKLVAETGR